jgi:hypothetical protein
VRRRNDLVVAVTTNFGSLSSDLLNRSLPIHLELVGDITDRDSAIGNPKLQYLPEHAAEIEAELRGMIEKWKEEGCPRDEKVFHPFAEWAAVVGGILMVSSFPEFLGNYSIRRMADDPLRRGLGLLGAARPDAWLRPAELADLVVHLGLEKTIIPEADRGSDEGRRRGVGVVLRARLKESFVAETEDHRVTMILDRARRRFGGEKPRQRYRFQIVKREELPEDPDE